MTLPTTVRSYKSTDYGAPALRGVAGDLIAVLDAALVNGYGSRAVQSITRSGSVATVTLASHTHNEHDVVTISGADQTEYNGTHRVFNVTTDTYQFDVTGTPATQATGTILNAKPGGGWTKPHSATNKAAYRSANVQSTQFFLRVDDSTTTYATVTGYEYLDSIDVGGGLFPAVTAPLYWIKSGAADTTARAWELVTDGSMFYLFIAHHTTNVNGHALFSFGDILSMRQGDAFNCWIVGSSATTASQQPGANSQSPLVGYGYLSPNNPNTQVIARSYTQVGAPVDVQKLMIGFNSGNDNFATGQDLQLAYPHATDNSLVAMAPIIAESASVLRGVTPGFYFPLHDRPGTRLDVIGDWPSLPGRKLWLIPMGNGAATNGAEGRCVVDVTGPWR